MSGITFGSVGDIIAVGQIALQLAKALSDSRGSAKAYQALVKELQNFDQALLQVITLWQNYDESPELRELGRITNDIVRDWRDVLLKFRGKIDGKYGISLSPGGSGRWLKDASKKVGWLREKGDVLELRQKLQVACGTINMLCNATIGTSNRLDSSAQKERSEGVYAILQHQMSQINKIEAQLISQVKTSVSMLIILRSGMNYLHEECLSIIQKHILSIQTTPYGLGTHWQQAPVTLEDALGRLFPIPLETIKSWKTLDVIVADHFEGRPGYEKIRRREYVIEDDLNGHELSRKEEFGLSVRPGQKVNMSMVLLGMGDYGTSCLRCMKPLYDAFIGSRTQCQNANCKMWFQRHPAEVIKVGEQKENVAPFKSDTYYGPARLPGGDISDRNTTLGESSTPRNFQRVRILADVSYRCGHTACTKTFKRRAAVRRHEGVAHGSMTRGWLCPIAECYRSHGMEYRELEELKQHLWKMHGHLDIGRA